MIKHVVTAVLTVAGIAFMAAQPARAAALFICDFDTCANGVNSPDPNITFSMIDFEGASLSTAAWSRVDWAIQQPRSSRKTGALFDGAAMNTFSGDWIFGGPITPQNQTIFFTGDDPLDAGGVSDVLHYSYSVDPSVA